MGCEENGKLCKHLKNAMGGNIVERCCMDATFDTVREKSLSDEGLSSEDSESALGVVTSGMSEKKNRLTPEIVNKVHYLICWKKRM